MTLYSDLFELDEDERIAVIGAAVEAGNVVSFFTDNDEKLDRYLEKLKKSYKVRLIHRGLGPVPHTVVAFVGPQES